jgi:hypothetical protein
MDTRNSDPDFAALGRSRTKRNLAIFGSCAALAIAAASVWAVQDQKRAKLETEAKAAQFRTCLLGGPLESDETEWERFRRMSLSTIALSEKERREQASQLWPFACKDELIGVRDLIRADFAPDESKAFDALLKVLGDFSTLPPNIAEVSAPVVSALNTRLPGAIPAPAEPLPPRPRGVDELKAIAPLSPHGSSFQGTYTEENPGIGLPVLVVEEGLTAPLLCVFRSSELKASCARYPELLEAKRHGLRLLGTSDTSDNILVFAGRRGASGVYVAKTSGSSPQALRVDGLYSFGGTVLADGSAAVLGWDEAKSEMVLGEAAPGKPAVRTALKPNFRVGNYFYSSQLLWGHVLVRGVTPENERRLFSLSVQGKTKSFDVVDVGELPEAGLIRPGEEDKPHLTGCRTDETMVIRVRGYDRDFVTFRTGDHFSTLTSAPTWGTLGCSGGAATFVTAGYAASGTELFFGKCTPAGCDLKQLKGDVLDRNTTELRPQDERHVQAVALKDKLLVVWIAGETGGLRMRMAEPDLFARAKDVVLLDDRTEDGKKAIASSILGFRLYSRGEFAVLLLSSMAGVHAFRIDPNGNLEPYQLSN